MDIVKLRELDVMSVCALLGLERDKDDYKQFKSDGYRITVTGFKWFDHNAHKGGGGAIDLTMYIKNCTFFEACNYLASVSGDIDHVTHTTTTHKPQQQTKPPPPSIHHLTTVKSYLVGNRGLNAELVQWCIDKNIIYADSRFNCVFRYGLKGAELRGTGDKQWRAVYGVIEHGFILPAHKAVGIAVVESAIDALSYRQLHKTIITISLAGNGNHAVIEQACLIAKNKSIPIIAAFDNDKGGDIATEILSDYAIQHNLPMFNDRPIQRGFDWNDELKQQQSLKRYSDDAINRLN
jgi:hypothetical protein